MSRLAQSVQKAVDDMKAASKKKGRKAKEAQVEHDEEGEGFTPELEEDDNEIQEPGDLPDRSELQAEQVSGKTSPDLTQQVKPEAGNKAAKGSGKRKQKEQDTVAKKAAKKAKAPKAPKAAKAKGERKPRERKVASGKITKIEASGNTYITLTFEEGTITLTPTGHREENAAIAAKALRALL